MFPASALLLLPVLAGLTVAQTTTVVTLALPFADSQDIHASVIGAGSAATTFSLACPSGTDDTDCGLGEGMTVTEGPSTLAYHYTRGEEFHITVHCAITGDDATCAADYSSGSSTELETETIADWAGYRTVPVTVTAGMEKLKSGSGSNPSSATPTISASLNTVSSTAVKSGDTLETAPTGTATGTGLGAGAGAGATSSSTAGVPRITQHAVLAGVAAVVGGAMML
ncbi:hypothetical protein B0H67DRAFT_644694 [Lasiosphaeris hirsuta]|uniref:GPI anchored protein n=1 Tax=Lasiosphaeris hirsuta TaxID=260670 RepID=A0AA40AFJ2_9PEZI|nr:hypothetical protein B0H67DRAFT_644694 [Lasiosphaeris hirsuta]